MYNSKQFIPIPIRAHSVTAQVKAVIEKAISAQLYDKTLFKAIILGYYYSNVLMYSVMACSKKAILMPVNLRFSWDDIAEAISQSLEGHPKVEVFFGEASYQAPSSVKFLVIIKT
jgi:hypothetical protein